MKEKRGRVYNRIFDEQEWKEVNQNNKYAMEDFLEEYKQRKIKDSTIKQYFHDLRIVLLYIKRKLNNRDIFDLNKKDFRRFSLWLSDELKVSNARANRVMSAVRSLLTYCEDDDDYDYENNVAKKVKGLPREPVRTNEDDFFLSFEQVMKLREELLNRGRLQDAVLLMLFFDSGGRRNEVFQIIKNGILDGNKTNIVTGKRGKTFPLVYLNDTRDLIANYLKERGEDSIDSLWIMGKGENKRPVTYEALYDRVVAMSKILSEIEGKKIEFFPHSFRHSRCECLLQGHDARIIDKNTGLPKKFTLEEVQLFLHHSDPKTTQSYAKDHTEEIINNMFDFS
jgi:site-specific recombinase XerD